jgi:hypothetical protein
MFPRFTYDEGVEDGEPLDVGVGHGLQDVVPPARPLRLHVHLADTKCTYCTKIKITI